MDQSAQVHVDGFVSREELLEMMRLGAVGELTGWAFDAQGRHYRRRHKRSPDQHSAAGPRRGPDHRRSGRSRQGRGDRGGAEGASDQRLDHRRGDGKRHPETVSEPGWILSALAARATPSRRRSSRLFGLPFARQGSANRQS